MLEQLLAEVPPGVERADVLFALASTSPRQHPELIALCDEALAEAAGDDARSARILASRGFVHLLAADVPRPLADARAALEKAERAGDPALLAVAIARVGQAETWAAEITPGLLERGVEIEERLGLELEYHESPRVALARLLMRLGELDRAARDLRGAGGEGGGAGRRRHPGTVLWPLSMLEWLAGRWQRALEHAAVAEELAEQTRPPARSRLDGTGRRRSSRPTSASSRRRAPRPRKASRTRRRCSYEFFAHHEHSVFSAVSSSRSATSRRPAATCASFPGGCSRAV